MARRLGSLLILSTPDWLGPRPNFVFVEGTKMTLRRPLILKTPAGGRMLATVRGQTS